METFFFRTISCRDSMFKSYYVVWKLLGRLSEVKYHLVFKSYYVVWKLGS